jgi:protein TonB
MYKFLSVLTILLFSLISSVQSQVSEAPFAYVEVMPIFRGGPEAMYKFMYDHIVYPDSARISGIQGTVVAEFVVDIDSLIKDSKIIRSIGGGCDEEVLRLFDLMNAQKLWIPGRHNNRNVPVTFTMPVKFVLEGTDKKKSKKSKPGKVNP